MRFEWDEAKSDECLKEREFDFEWDEAKSDKCLKKTGFDFDFATRAFRDPLGFVKQDLRKDYGEDRFTLLGKIDERVHVVVYTPRGLAIRIISARKANDREIAAYGDKTRQGRP